MKKLISFDLDGTLAESKSAIDEEMATLLMKLLEKFDVAIISGGDYPQYAKQVIPFLTNKKLLNKLYLYPTCGTKAYIYKNDVFQQIYSENLNQADIENAIKTIEYAIKKFELVPEKTYGDLIENRGTQITYSALGQEAPHHIKKLWDPDFVKRSKIRDFIQPLLPNLSISMGGSTSIDITNKGIDKAYAIEKLKQQLDITEDEILFIGDALMEGGNDYAVRRTGTECLQVNSVNETKSIIKQLLS